MNPARLPGILVLAAALSACTSLRTPATDVQGPGPLHPTGPGAGFRYSTYGSPDNMGPEYWVSVGERMASKFDGAHPETIWIVGSVYGEGTHLSFHEDSDDPLIYSGYVDMNDAILSMFDERGFRVWLQVEPGNADMETLIHLTMNQYKHHPSVTGFGVDVEWYKSVAGPLGEPITDQEAERWVKAVRSHGDQYRLFLKHWEAEWMPPTFRDGIVFVNDAQEFESLDAMVAEFAAWGERFAPYPVGYQYGYPSDQIWWRDLEDPPGDIGRRLLEQIPNTASLFWVDFSILDVFPADG